MYLPDPAFHAEGRIPSREAEELVLRAYDSPLKIRGLLVAGILIAALGAVMDVSMSIASACGNCG